MRKSALRADCHIENPEDFVFDMFTQVKLPVYFRFKKKKEEVVKGENQQYRKLL